MTEIKQVKQEVISHLVYDVKDKETKVKTGEQKVIINYVGKKKNPESGYYEDAILPFFMSLTDFLKVVGLSTYDKEKANVNLKGKMLVVKTEIL